MHKYPNFLHFFLEKIRTRVETISPPLCYNFYPKQIIINDSVEIDTYIVFTGLYNDGNSVNHIIYK